MSHMSFITCLFTVYVCVCVCVGCAGTRQASQWLYLPTFQHRAQMGAVFFPLANPKHQLEQWALVESNQVVNSEAAARDLAWGAWRPLSPRARTQTKALNDCVLFGSVCSNLLLYFGHEIIHSIMDICECIVYFGTHAIICNYWYCLPNCLYSYGKIALLWPFWPLCHQRPLLHCLLWDFWLIPAMTRAVLAALLSVEVWGTILEWSWMESWYKLQAPQGNNGLVLIR